MPSLHLNILFCNLVHMCVYKGFIMQKNRACSCVYGCLREGIEWGQCTQNGQEEEEEKRGKEFIEVQRKDFFDGNGREKCARGYTISERKMKIVLQGDFIELHYLLKILTRD